MRKELTSHYGKWSIEGFVNELNGYLEIDHHEKNYQLRILTEEPIEIPYFTDLVFGKTYKGKSFALMDCTIRQNVSSSYVHDFQKRYELVIQCNYILEDCFFEKIEEALITDIKFKLSNMDIWANKDPIEIIEFDENDGVLIKAKQPDNLSAKCDDFILSIDYLLMPDSHTNELHEFKIKMYCDFIVTFNSPVTLNKALAVIYQVKDFLTLCVGKRTYIENILATPQVPVKYIDRCMPFEIYGPGIEKGNIDDIPKVHFIDMNLRLNEIADKFELVIQNWFLKSERLKPIIDLYMGIYYQRTSYERYFLNVVQALEAYHRLTRKNEVLPKEEHNLKIESILTSVPLEHKKWLQGKLNFSNEPSLHERLEDLFKPIKDIENEHYGKAFNLFKLQNKSIESLIRDIKNTRNYNTHFDEKLERKSIKGQDLVRLTQLLVIMLEYYLMKELELDDETIIKIANEKVIKISQQQNYMEAIKKVNINRKRKEYK